MKGLGLGTALTGISNGFNQYQQQQYQQQMQAQMQNAQIQQMQATTDSIKTKTSLEQEQIAQQKAAGAMLPAALEYAKSSMAQMADPADAYSQPSGSADLSQVKPLTTGLGANAQPAVQGKTNQGALLDALRMQESGGNNMAVSKAGAKGPYQFMDSTAKMYGLTDPFNPTDSRAAADKMMTHLEQKYNGDTTKALQAYNWGEGNMDAYLKTGKGAKGQDMPVETQKYAQSVLRRMGKVTDPELVGPAATAAENLRTAGGSVPSELRESATKQQKSVADTLEKVSEFYMMSGNVDMAEKFSDKAQKARSVEVQQRQIALSERKESLQETGGLISTVKTQADYTNALNAIKKDPIMRANLQGLNPTGVLAQDRHIVDALQQRTMTVKDQENLKLRKESSDIKAAQEEMKEKKFDIEKTREDAFMDDQMRKADGARKAGVPKDQVPEGLIDPKSRVRVAAALATNNNKLAQQDNASVATARKGVAILDQMESILTKQGLKTGPGIGQAEFYTGNVLAGTFDKLGNDLVDQLQQGRSGAGSQTAAKYKLLMTSKPEVGKTSATNLFVINHMRADLKEQTAKVEFTNQYSMYNSNRADADKWWNQYTTEHPLYTYDRKTGEQKIDPDRPTWQEYFKGQH